jgi:hypothetical protein
MTIELEILKKYAESFGFKVNLNSKSSEMIIRRGTLNVPSKIKIINTNSTHQCYLLLHELGHWELMKDWTLYKQRYHFTSIGEEFALDKIYKYRRRIAYKVDIMREEFDAWETGKNLAAKLNLNIDTEDYDRYSISYLFSYIKHLGKKK